MKQCRKCNETKDLEDFFIDRNNKSDGRYSVCKECKKKALYEWRAKNREKYNSDARDWARANKLTAFRKRLSMYNCSVYKYEHMLETQAYKCKICGLSHNAVKTRGRLHVDHCHDTGLVRGLLCNKCNAILGYSRDRVDLLEKSIEYLKENAWKCVEKVKTKE